MFFAETPLDACEHAQISPSPNSSVEKYMPIFLLCRYQSTGLRSVSWSSDLCLDLLTFALICHQISILTTSPKFVATKATKCFLTAIKNPFNLSDGLNVVSHKFLCSSCTPQRDGVQRRGLWEVTGFR